MKVTVDGFVDAAREILAGIGLALRDVSTSEEGIEESAAIASVGIVGDATGSLLLRLDEESTDRIVRAMFADMGVHPGEHIDATLRAHAIGEFANEICGRTATRYSEFGVQCDITPPAVMSGSRITSSLPGVDRFETRCLTGDFGQLLLSLGVRPG